MNRFTRYLRKIVYLEDSIDRASAAEKAASVGDTVKHQP